MKKSIISLFLLYIVVCQKYVFACSVFSIPIYDGSTVKNVIGSRTMDFVAGVSAPIAMGLAGESNVSTINVNENAVANAATWNNKYSYIGKTMSPNGDIVDGINTEGVYASVLYLVGTRYPRYNLNIPKKSLDIFNVVNYVLGTSNSVSDALDNLSKVQINLGSISLFELHVVVPLHIYIADKAGDVAIIEFIDGETIVSHSKELRVLANYPSINLQEEAYNQYLTNQSQKNSMDIFDNLPGDFSSTSRYIRMSEILKYSPKSYTDSQASYVSNMILRSIIAPAGMSRSPTLWSSQFNLEEGSYKINNYMLIDNKSYILPTDTTHSYNFKSNNVIRVKLTRTIDKSIITEEKALEILEQTEQISAQYNRAFIKPKW